MFTGAAVGATVAVSAVTVFIAFPTRANLQLASPLRALSAEHLSSVQGEYARDFAPLSAGFRAQTYRSFCGPASIATVLRAYGEKQVDQRSIFQSLSSKLDTFYTGMNLGQLATLAQSVGLHGEIVYADTLNIEAFRERLKENLRHEGDFVLINYSRRVLKQDGGGHISPVGAYDEGRDAFLVLDESAYKYPFTWVPTYLLYEAARTRDDERYRGLLFIQAYGLRN